MGILAIKTLMSIQNELKAPKNQYNGFGKYKYRNCEDILEALKPICNKFNSAIVLSDELVTIGDRYYVKATATLYCFNENKEKFSAEFEKISSEAYAREELDKKGMDGSQVTGASSSYARKYALNGLFGIDDTKDSDSTNTGGKTENKGENSSEVKEDKQTPTNKENNAKTVENLTLEQALEHKVKVIDDTGAEFNLAVKDIYRLCKSKIPELIKNGDAITVRAFELAEAERVRKNEENKNKIKDQLKV